MRRQLCGSTAAMGRMRKWTVGRSPAQALEDAGLDRDERLRQVLHDYFASSTTTTMARYHRCADDVPERLPIPRWSWEGLAPGTDPESSRSTDR